MLNRHTIIAVLALVLSMGDSWTAALAQSGHNLERPPHWRIRPDAASDSDERRFVVMRPGWHVDPGPAGLIWDPGRFASGNYSVTSTIFLFPQGDEVESSADSPYGVFLGGENLEGEAAYTSYEIGNDGRFRVTTRNGDGVREIVAWKEHPAIVRLATPPEGTAKNEILVDVKDDIVAFYVNGALAAEIPRDGLRLDGTVGLRAGAGLSLHVTDITVGPNRRDE